MNKECYKSLHNITKPTTSDIVGNVSAIIGVVIAIIAAILTFFAFWVQFEANQQQKLDLKRERFENKFYKMLDIQIKNAENLVIGKETKGRSCFVKFTTELTIAKNIIDEIIKKNSINSSNLWLSKHWDHKLRFVYTIFFFGTGENSEKYYTNELSSEGKRLLLLFNKEKESHVDKNMIKDYNSAGCIEKVNKLQYCLFQGHVNKLSFYYRHLYQIVKFVTNSDHNFLSYKDKLDYIKIIRAQLSDYEQLLLYYNAISWFKAEWSDPICKYQILKNIPFSQINLCKLPTEVYSRELNDAKQHFQKLIPEKDWQPFNFANHIPNIY